MNIPDGFFENPVSPEYADLLSTMGAPIYFTEALVTQRDSTTIDVSTIAGVATWSLCKVNWGAQYEEVQPDLHSLERYDFSKMPDLPWYP